MNRLDSAEAGSGIIVRGGIARGGPGATGAGEPETEVWGKTGLGELLGEMDQTEFILRYTLSHPHCHTTIVGTMNLDHLAANLLAAEKGPLPKELYDRAGRQVRQALKG